jgi:hypothetical protein
LKILVYIILYILRAVARFPAFFLSDMRIKVHDKPEWDKIHAPWMALATTKAGAKKLCFGG